MIPELDRIMKKLILITTLFLVFLQPIHALDGKYRLCASNSENSSMQIQLLFIGSDKMVNSTFLFKNANCEGKPDWENIITTEVSYEEENIMKVKTGDDSFTKASYSYADHKLHLKFEEDGQEYTFNRVD